MKSIFLRDEAQELVQSNMDSHEHALRHAADEFKEINFSVGAGQFEDAADRLIKIVAALKEVEKQLRPVTRLLCAFADSETDRKEKRCRRK